MPLILGMLKRSEKEKMKLNIFGLNFLDNASKIIVILLAYPLEE